jgi:signal transduction histidine kinase
VTAARKRGHGLGIIGDVLRLVGAAALLAAVVIATVHEINGANRKVSERRVQDRVELAKALAVPLKGWLQGAQAAALSTAAGKPVGGWDALRVDRAGAFTGLSGRYVSLSGMAQTHPCPAGSGLRDLVDAAAKSASPVVMMVNPPGTCEPLIGAAAAGPGGTTVVTTDVDAFLAQAAVAAHFQTGRQAFIVDPAGTTVTPGADPRPIPTHLGPFVAQVSSGPPIAARNTVVDANRTVVVDAGAAIDGGWAVVVEQDAADLDTTINVPRSALLLAGALFLMILLLQLTSDARRRAAARHAEAHNAAFLAVLGHELRTPLTVIKGFVDTLSSRWDRLEDQQRHDLVDRLPMQTRRLNRVVDRILVAANLQAGAASALMVEPIDVAPTLERVAADYTPASPLHEFIVEAGPDVRARADAKALQQIVEQLVDNAVKYSPAGGVVRLRAERRSSGIVITVEDEGVGLPKDTRSIFDAFAQGEEVDSRVHAEGGVGLGLFIVRTLCKQLGGSVRAERRDGTGSRFVVTLRACRARVALAV